MATFLNDKESYLSKLVSQPLPKRFYEESIGGSTFFPFILVRVGDGGESSRKEFFANELFSMDQD